MTTPERSIDEIVKEVLALEHEIDEDDNWISTDEDIANIVRFVVKAERQKREEVVGNFAGMLRTLIERGNTETAMNIIREKSIHPNNPK